MSDVKKQERDFSPEVDALLPEATLLAQVIVSDNLPFNPRLNFDLVRKA